jgi:hypothetical protein
MESATAAAMAFIREADAAISPQALESEFRIWWMQSLPDDPPTDQTVAMAVAWARHILSRGRRTATL